MAGKNAAEAPTGCGQEHQKLPQSDLHAETLSRYAWMIVLLLFPVAVRLLQEGVLK